MTLLFGAARPTVIASSRLMVRINGLKVSPEYEVVREELFERRAGAHRLVLVPPGGMASQALHDARPIAGELLVRPRQVRPDFDFPDRRMISAVPQPSDVARMLRATPDMLLRRAAIRDDRLKAAAIFPGDVNGDPCSYHQHQLKPLRPIWASSE